MSQLVKTPVDTWSLVDLTWDEVSMIASALGTAIDVINTGTPMEADDMMRGLAQGVLDVLEAADGP